MFKTVAFNLKICNVLCKDALFNRVFEKHTRGMNHPKFVLRWAS